MASKELRKMKRMELLDIIYALQENEEKLKKENEELKKRLEERVIKMDKEGSMAAAAVSISGVMEAAQAAADQYLESVYAKHRDTEARAQEIYQDAHNRAQAIVAAADQYYRTIQTAGKEAEKLALRIRAEARENTKVFLAEENAKVAAKEGAKATQSATASAKAAENKINAPASKGDEKA